MPSPIFLFCLFVATDIGVGYINGCQCECTGCQGATLLAAPTYTPKSVDPLSPDGYMDHGMHPPHPRYPDIPRDQALSTIVHALQGLLKDNAVRTYHETIHSRLGPPPRLPPPDYRHPPYHPPPEYGHGPPPPCMDPHSHVSTVTIPIPNDRPVSYVSITFQ